MMNGELSSSSGGAAIIIVNPYLMGCCIVQEISKWGYVVIALWMAGFLDVMKMHIPLSCEHLTYYVECNQEDALTNTVQVVQRAVEPYKIVDVLAGGEAGVDLADGLSEAMQLQTNGMDIPSHHDKKIQQELIQQAGLCLVCQVAGK